MEDQNILDQNPEEARNRILKPTIEYGLIAALVIIAYTLLAYFLGFLMQSLLNWAISMVIYAALVSWILTNYRRSEGNGYLSYGRGLGIGTLSFVWAGVISALFSYFFFDSIAPEVIDQMLQMQYEGMIEDGMSEEMAESMTSTSAKFMTPVVMSIGGFFSSVFFGFVISLIVSAFVRKSPLD